jgi:hypothetical protein
MAANRLGRSRLFLFSAFCLLPPVLLWRLTLHPTGIAFAPQAAFSDLLISHLPNAQYVHDSLTQFGQLPLWQTRILSGQPFAADPLAGLWYPPNWRSEERRVGKEC